MKKRNFSVLKHDEVVQDLQTIVDYYNNAKSGLGNQFYKSFQKQSKLLKNDCLFYEIRYSNVRCVKIGKFPFLIHYAVNELNKEVFIHAVIGMKQNPDETWGKR